MREPARLVLITVFDGLRWDFVRPDWTPNLWRLRGEGVWFSRSHCVFPAVTRVNASSMVTGSRPLRHGINANTIWRPDVERSRPLRTGDRADLLRLREVRGRLLAVPTLGEVLAAHGERLVVVGTGSAGAATLLGPQDEDPDNAVLHFSFSVPEDLNDTVAVRLGPWPVLPNDTPYEDVALARVRYGWQALTAVLAPRYRPSVCIFWCTVPDGPHHRYGLGDPRSVRSLREADQAFGEALTDLSTLYEALDIIVTADHGYVTVDGHVDVTAELNRAGSGFGDAEGAITCADGGGVALHLPNPDDAEPLARWLLAQAWISAVFSPAGRVPGTLSLEDAGNGGPDAPDLLLCLGWSDTVNAHNVPGRGWGAGGIAVGAGDHGGLSPWEMHNTLLMAGPSFRTGVEVDAPAGIVDVAPTVLQVLGIAAPAAWDGRVLREALHSGDAALAAETEERNVLCGLPSGRVRQRLTLHRAGESRYAYAAGREVV